MLCRSGSWWGENRNWWTMDFSPRRHHLLRFTLSHGRNHPRPNQRYRSDREVHCQLLSVQNRWDFGLGRYLGQRRRACRRRRACAPPRCWLGKEEERRGPLDWDGRLRLEDADTPSRFESQPLTRDRTGPCLSRSNKIQTVDVDQRGAVEIRFRV